MQGAIQRRWLSLLVMAFLLVGWQPLNPSPVKKRQNIPKAPEDWDCHATTATNLLTEQLVGGVLVVSNLFNIVVIVRYSFIAVIVTMTVRTMNNSAENVDGISTICLNFRF